jgi:hypothetical protein
MPSKKEIGKKLRMIIGIYIGQKKVNFLIIKIF